MLNDPSETWMQDKYVIRHTVTPYYVRHIKNGPIVVINGRGHQVVYTSSPFRLPVTRGTRMLMFYAYSE